MGVIGVVLCLGSGDCPICSHISNIYYISIGLLLQPTELSIERYWALFALGFVSASLCWGGACEILPNLVNPQGLQRGIGLVNYDRPSVD